MKAKAKAVLALAPVLLPSLALAGGIQQGTNIPTLGEVGLVTLGLSLLSGGLVILRKKQR